MAGGSGTTSSRGKELAFMGIDGNRAVLSLIAFKIFAQNIFNVVVDRPSVVIRKIFNFLVHGIVEPKPRLFLFRRH